MSQQHGINNIRLQVAKLRKFEHGLRSSSNHFDLYNVIRTYCKTLEANHKTSIKAVSET